ncbi:MAG: precorrin-8X methylmutase [Oscillospiraceae bacterium]|nr:precorrin-8X methylmutase [Oscillospiraceae bacterium]
MEFEYITNNECIALIKKNAVKATKDAAFSECLYFSPDVINFSMGALNAGFHIVCDTVAIKSSLHRMPMAKLGIIAHCFADDKDVLKRSGGDVSRRAVLAVERAAALHRPLIFAIGNMPESLTRINEMTAARLLFPKLVIAAPVGYSEAVESKEKLVSLGVPCIVSLGMKGGSDAAAAICNTLLDLAAPSRLNG